MTKLIGTLVVSGTLALLPAMARPQEDQEAPWSDLGIGEEPEAQAPSTAQPDELPPAPQYETQYAPPAQAEAPAAPPAQAPASAPAGQWIYTQQYGWIWMPYADAYTYAPANGYGEPYAYVYYPAHACWTWVAAPWVWGFGPWPFFGVFGPARFGWYGHGWWRYPQRWHYAPLHGGYAGFRAAPAYRGGVYGGFRPAPAYRGAPGYGGVRPAPFRPAPSRAGFGFVGGGGGRGFAAPRAVPGRSGFAPGAGRAWGHGAPAFNGRGSSGGHGGFGSGGHGGHGGWHLGRGRG
ncbi:MAG TPA: hypothetical protein VIV57_16275 [Anaeromyxobacter sp.]